MRTLLTTLKALALVVLIGAGALLCGILWRNRSLDLTAPVAGVNTTLANVNRPCKGPAGPDACGTLAQINKVAIDAGDIAVTAQMQVRQSGQLISAATENINRVAAHISGTADALTGTVNAAAEAIDQARADLVTANGTIAAAQPLIEASTRTVEHADATIATVSPNLDRLIRASADTSEHVSGITDDTHKMTTHLEHDFDTPKPWWNKALPVFTDSAKLAECLTRGNCF